MQKRSLTPSIFVVEDVYSREECRAWIAFSETHVYDAAPIAQVVIAPDLRNNTRVMMDVHRLRTVGAASAQGDRSRLAPLRPQ